MRYSVAAGWMGAVVGFATAGVGAIDEHLVWAAGDDAVFDVRGRRAGGGLELVPGDAGVYR